MASILGRSQINLFNTILTDGDPQAGAGTSAAVGTIGQDSNNGQLNYKYGATDTEWHLYTLPFGDFFQTVERTTPLSTTTPTFLSYLVLTTPTIPAGDYYWTVSGGINTSGGGVDVSARMVVDGVIPTDPVLRQQASVGTGRLPLSAFGVINAATAGIHTVDAQFNQPAGGGTATMQGCVIALWRVST